MPDTSKPNSTEPEPEGEKSSQASAPEPEQEQKLNIAIWVILATGAGIIDAAQIGLEALLIGTVLNPLIDIFVGLSLGTFFLVKGMLNWQTGLSIFGGFAVDFISDGILPAWVLDIGIVWLQTDGSKQLGKIPFIGEKARQAALMAIQRGRKGTFQETQKKFEESQKKFEETTKNSGKKSVDGIKPGTKGGTQKTQKTEEGSTRESSATPQQNSATDREQKPPTTSQQDSTAQSGNEPSGSQEATGGTGRSGKNTWKEQDEISGRSKHNDESDSNHPLDKYGQWKKDWDAAGREQEPIHQAVRDQDVMRQARNDPAFMKNFGHTLTDKQKQMVENDK